VFCLHIDNLCHPLGLVKLYFKLFYSKIGHG
jgi:hypothetical protein